MPDIDNYRDPERQRTLLGAVEHLDETVATLARRFDGVEEANEKIHVQQKWIHTLGAVVVVLLLAVASGAWYFLDKTNDLVKQNQQNQVTSCEGANDRVEDQRKIWEGLVLNSEPRNAGEKAWLEAVQEYTDQTYSKRDCTRLDIPYKGPDEDFPLLDDYLGE